MMIPRHLLVTISDEISCLYGVRFVRSFFRNKEALKITLFYVVPSVGGTKGGAGLARQTRQKLARAYERRGREALDESKALLCESGFNPAQVECRLASKQLGTVKDILREAGRGGYDALVLGRRGYALFESVLADSVSREIVARDSGLPLWVCRQPEEQRRNVLLCVDGSEPSLHMADHVGFVVENQPEHAVTICHVDTGEAADKERLLQRAKEELLRNGIPEPRISLQILPPGNVVKSILRQAAGKSYAVVAVGRAGMKKGLLEQWLVGSRSMKLLANLEKAVLWVSR